MCFQEGFLSSPFIIYIFTSFQMFLKINMFIKPIYKLYYKCQSIADTNVNSGKTSFKKQSFFEIAIC